MVKHIDITFQLTVPANGKATVAIATSAVPVDPSKVIALTVVSSGAGWTIGYSAQIYGSGYYLFANSLYPGDVPDTVVVRVVYT